MNNNDNSDAQLRVGTDNVSTSIDIKQAAILISSLNSTDFVLAIQNGKFVKILVQDLKKSLK